MARRRPDLFRSGYAVREGAGGVVHPNPFGNDWFFLQAELAEDANFPKVQAGYGESPDRPSTDFDDLLTRVASGDTIWTRGKVTGNFVAPEYLADITIIGASTKPKHGSTTNTTDMGGASFFPTTSSDPIFTLHVQGWQFVNVLFAAGATDYAIEIQSDGGATPEHSGGNSRFWGCRFAGGAGGINCNGGSGFVEVAHCRFETLTTGAIVNTSTANALPLQWDVHDNIFANGSAEHINAPASKWSVYRNIFHTVASTGKYIDFTDGSNNVVTGNTLGGTYDNSDYVAGTSDIWAGNYGAAGLLSDVPPTTA